MKMDINLLEVVNAAHTNVDDQHCSCGIKRPCPTRELLEAYYRVTAQVIATGWTCQGCSQRVSHVINRLDELAQDFPCPVCGELYHLRVMPAGVKVVMGLPFGVRDD